MLRYVAQRLVLLVATLVGVATITFFLSRVLPSSPVQMMLGFHPTAEVIAAAEKELGLDQPLYKQYLRFVSDAVRGDFGISLRTKQPVVEEIGRRALATVELTVLTVALLVVIGVPAGVISAVHNNSPLDNTVRILSIAGVAFPSFVVGMLLQMLFYGHLDWLPLQGRLSSEIYLDHPFARTTGLFLVDSLLAGDFVVFKDALRHILLPLATLTLVTLPLVTRITRNLMMEVVQEDYVRTALAYGMPPFVVYYRYALKAMLIPLMTVVGLTLGFLLGGSVVVEFIFDWPGLGGYVARSISAGDFPATVGATLVLASAYLSVNLIVDLLYFVSDPRLRVA